MLYQISDAGRFHFFICPIYVLVLRLLAFQTWKEQHPLTLIRFPVATGLGGPSGLEDSPFQPSRENRKRAESLKRVTTQQKDGTFIERSQPVFVELIA